MTDKAFEAGCNAGSEMMRIAFKQADRRALAAEAALGAMRSRAETAERERDEALSRIDALDPRNDRLTLMAKAYGAASAADILRKERDEARDTCATIAAAYDVAQDERTKAEAELAQERARHEADRKTIEDFERACIEYGYAADCGGYIADWLRCQLSSLWNRRRAEPCSSDESTRLREAARLGYELSTWAASISWSPYEANTVEWLTTLRQKITATQAACRGLIPATGMRMVTPTLATPAEPELTVFDVLAPTSCRHGTNPETCDDCALEREFLNNPAVR